MGALFDDFDVFQDHAFANLGTKGLLEALEDTFRRFVHLEQELVVLFLFQIVEGPFTIVRADPPKLREVLLDLAVDAVQVPLHQLELHILLVCSVLAVFIEQVEGFLANGHFQVVPVVMPHEVVKFRFGKNTG